MEFVSFGIAKKLKEKKFMEECFATYDIEDGEFDFNNYVIRVAYKMNVTAKDCLRLFNNTNTGLIDAPTISQVLKWLEVEKQIYILVEPFPSIATKDKVCWSWSLKWNSDGINIEHTFPDDFTYLTSQEATLAGIKHALDNLI